MTRTQREAVSPAPVLRLYPEKQPRPIVYLLLSLITVTLELLLEDEKCSNRPVTARCRVRRPVDSTQQFLLLWQCDDTGTRERVIFCNDDLALELDCHFGKLYDIRSSCICNETFIESEATFNTTSMCDVILYCSDGVENAEVSVSIKGEVLKFCTRSKSGNRGAADTY